MIYYVEPSYTKEDIMTGLQIIGYVLVFVVGAAAGAWGYRYTLKRDPEKLEAWARAAKLAGEKAKDRFK